jgi:hypothetical protein
MPATRKKSVSEYKQTFGARPLPPHFGEIDVAAPFDVERYFTMLRCVGANPKLCRLRTEKVMFEEEFPIEGAGLSPTSRRRRWAAHAWANAKDSDSSQINSYLNDIVAKKPDGDFIHYLG